MKKVLNWNTLYVFVLVSIFLLLFVLPKVHGAQEITFSSLLPPLAAENSAINAGYLLEAIKQRPDVKIFFSNTDSARHSLLLRLKILPHINYELPCNLSAKPESIMNFSLPQLVRIYLILDALEKGDLKNQIGKIIASYEKDSQYEPGGIGLSENGRLVFEQIASDYFVKPADILAGYKLPKKASARPHIFTFHFHPRFFNRSLPSPSWSAEFADGMEADINYDIGEALSRAKLDGDSHQLLISELPNRTFNLAYYLAEKVEPSASPDPFSFCGRLAGLKIVNLGIWRY
jgi:hypothetical protein